MLTSSICVRVGTGRLSGLGSLPGQGWHQTGARIGKGVETEEAPRTPADDSFASPSTSVGTATTAAMRCALYGTRARAAATAAACFCTATAAEAQPSDCPWPTWIAGHILEPPHSVGCNRLCHQSYLWFRRQACSGEPTAVASALRTATTSATAEVF